MRDGHFLTRPDARSDSNSGTYDTDIVTREHVGTEECYLLSGARAQPSNDDGVDVERAPETTTTNAARQLKGLKSVISSPVPGQPSSGGGMYDEDARGNVDVVEFAEGPGEINAADGEVDVYVAMDSGAIGHISPKEAMPAGVNLQTGPNGINRDLVAANGGAITNHGTAEVELVTEDDKAFNCTMMVADVTRPLHSTGVVCDTGKEVLHTAKGAVVVPAGSLSKHVTKAMIMARYPRKGGLYLARYRVRAPRRPGAAKPAGFTRQGPKR